MKWSCVIAGWMFFYAAYHGGGQFTIEKVTANTHAQCESARSLAIAVGDSDRVSVCLSD